MNLNTLELEWLKSMFRWREKIVVNDPFQGMYFEHAYNNYLAIYVQDMRVASSITKVGHWTNGERMAFWFHRLDKD